MPPEVSFAGRGAAISLLAYSLICSALGVALFALGIGGWTPRVVLGLGMLGLFLSTWQLLSRAKLRLDPDGFTYWEGFRWNFVPWASVSEFRTAGLFKRRVGWIYRIDKGPPRWVKAVGKFIGGVHEFLPHTYGTEPEELARYLNQALEEFSQ